jgi:curved DNA-binding protein
MEYKDYYKILEVKRDATQDEIKRAYRKLSRKYHPDVSKEPNAEQNFKEVGEAYEVLKDPEKRTAYDQLGTGWNTGQEFRPPPSWEESFAFRGGGHPGGDAADFSEFFESLFGGAAASGQRRRAGFHARGQDFHAKVQIDLEDAYHGAIRTITLQTPEMDEQGHIRARDRVLNVHIPKGVAEGQLIRLKGQGAPGSGEEAGGDMYLEVQFKPHPLYRVEGRDIHLHLPVAPWEAALGAKVKMPTPGGVVELKIPPGSATGLMLRMGGRGLPGKPPGDLFVVLQIALPSADSEQAKELYRRMEQELQFNPRAKLGV